MLPSLSHNTDYYEDVSSKEVPRTMEDLQILKCMVEVAICGYAYDRRDLQPWAPQFTCFSKLPAELRVKIWEFALPGPRVIELRCTTPRGKKFMTKNKVPKFPGGSALDKQAVAHQFRYLSDAPIPSALHVCQESRHEALKVYQLSLGWGATGGKVFVDFSRDTILIGQEIRDFFADVWYRGFPDMERIKHLACMEARENVRFHQLAHQFPATLLMKLPGLEELTLVRESHKSANIHGGPEHSTHQEKIDPRVPGRKEITFHEHFEKSNNSKVIKHLLSRQDASGNFLYLTGPRTRLPRPSVKYPGHTFMSQPQMEVADYWNSGILGLADTTDVPDEAIKRNKLFSKLKLATLKTTYQPIPWAEMSETDKEVWRLMQVIVNSVQYKLQDGGVAFEDLTEEEKETWNRMQEAVNPPSYNLNVSTQARPKKSDGRARKVPKLLGST